jgi:hypothetical protein
MNRTYRESLINTSLPVLFEEEDGVYYTGHAPNYIKVYVRGEGLHNRICHARITGLFRDGVMGELV